MTSGSMLAVEEARARILALVQRLEPVEVSLIDARDMVLAEDVRAGRDIPPLDNTAMDGYAVRAADTAGAAESSPVALRVVGELAAGYTWREPVGPGQALRIMTGAPMPPGADAVVPFEETDEHGLAAPKGAHRVEGAVRVLKAARPGANVRRAGEDVRADTAVLAAGTQLRAGHLGVLASLGIDRASCYRRPLVAIISTGDEVVSPGQPAGPGQIYDSNAYAVAALVQKYGGVPEVLGIARDTVEDLTVHLKAAMNADLVVTSAGVSRGDFDVVKTVLAQQGEIDFWLVNMRPGKPLAFGVLRGADGRRVPHLGLPGNPVSSMITFELFGRYALLKMRGLPLTDHVRLRAMMRDRIRMSDGRRFYARCIVSRTPDGGWEASLSGPQGSGVLTAMAAANGLAVVPEGSRDVQPGEEVDVLMLDWSAPELARTGP